jgi:hypothetical protein
VGGGFEQDSGKATVTSYTTGIKDRMCLTAETKTSVITLPFPVSCGKSLNQIGQGSN